jgi:bifunctional non-homologous end joining protein LigD
MIQRLTHFKVGSRFIVALDFSHTICMSQPKQNKRSASSKSTLSVKRLPAKKTTEKKSSKEGGTRPDADIVIDIRQNKDLSSIVELVKRKFPDAPRVKMPADLKPMLATLVDEPFNDEEWQFELKLDGYRALAYLKNGKSDLRSRNNLSFNQKFKPINDILAAWKINAVVDGEIVVLDEQGVPDFNGIQQWVKKKQGHLHYYVFDLLWLDGISLMEQPLHLRREALKKLVPESGILRFSDHIDGSGIDLFELVKKNKLEGIIAKKKNATYLPDSRAKTWLKIKSEERHEAVICGYTLNNDSDRHFSSLVLGVYDQEELKFIGQVGTGFNAKSQDVLMQKMRPLIIKRCPFDELPVLGAPVTWITPSLVCEVKYTELTKEGLMRHASFQGLREDKSTFEMNPEQEADTDEILSEAKEDEGKKMLVTPSQEEMVVTVDNQELKFTNLKKIYWPKEKITKGNLLNYYYSIADYMMPYMKDRPQSLNRFPNGINGESFYQKNMAGKVDKWLNTFKRMSDSSGDAKDFLICTNTASLLYMANLGCIEMNPWHSRAQSPLHPDWTVIDLDPGEIGFDKVIECAQVVKMVLDTLQVPSYPKTSGSTGIHIYVPLGAKYNYEQAKQLAELVANMVHEELPDYTSLVRNPQKRKDKIYIDYLQNRPIQTICAPYSVRPKPGATASAPLHWDEVKKGLQISQFTMKNMLQRVKTEGDLFKGVLGKGIDLNKTLKNLSSLI